MAATPNFLQIPGNIKQEFAPFVVNPGASINKTYGNSTLVTCEPLKFSFRPFRIQGKEPAGLLNMFPSSMSNNTELFALDLSFSNMNKIRTFNDLLNILPCITIREYLPDTKLDQCINLFNDIFTKIFAGKDNKDGEKAGKGVLDEIKSGLKDTTALKDRLSRVVDAVINGVESMETFLNPATNSAKSLDAFYTKQDNRYSYMVKFPFTIMYNLQSCVTTNIYELPCVPDGNALHSSSGRPGWDGSNYFALLPDFAKNIPILGKMIDTLFGNLRINFTPWWDSSKGQGTKAPELTFKFSLFNDTAQAACNNFIFVNTILQNNRWMQYHLFLHSSALYDVTIAGIGKQYACSGDVTVQYKGSLRKTSDHLKSLLRAHVGNRYNPNAIVTDELIKIPDIYDITVKFCSLLPLNFNTFMYNYLSQDTFNMKNAYKESAFSDIGTAIGNVIDKATTAWKTSKADAEAKSLVESDMKKRGYI